MPIAPPKQKGQKMDLGSFLTDKCTHTCWARTTGGTKDADNCVALGSWADEMEDAPMPSAPSGRGTYGGDRGYNSGGGFNSSSFGA